MTNGLKDLIEFNSIKRMMHIEAGISDATINPSISLSLYYVLNVGNGRTQKQQYFLAAKPQDVYVILEELKARKLVKPEEFENLKAHVGELEQKLRSSPSYEYTQ